MGYRSDLALVVYPEWSGEDGKPEPECKAEYQDKYAMLKLLMNTQFKEVIEGFLARQSGIGILDIDSTNISWSGFYSQGDGLAFDARVDVLAFMRLKGYDKTHMPLYLDMENYGASGRVSRGQRYSNFFAQGADIDFAVGNCEPAGIFSGMEQEAWDELVEEQWRYLEDDLANEIHEYASNAARELYRALEESYEADTSEEAFIESCECNEVTFEIEVDDEDTDEDCGQGLVAERSAV